MNLCENVFRFLPVTEHKHTLADKQSFESEFPGDNKRHRWTTCTFDELVAAVPPCSQSGLESWSCFHWRVRSAPKLFCHLANWWLRLERRRQRALHLEGLADNPIFKPNRNDVRELPLTMLLIELAKPLCLCRCSVRLLALVQSTLLPFQMHRLGGAYAPDLKRICAARLLVCVHDDLGRTCDRKLVAPPPLEASLWLSLWEAWARRRHFRDGPTAPATWRVLVSTEACSARYPSASLANLASKFASTIQCRTCF